MAYSPIDQTLTRICGSDTGIQMITMIILIHSTRHQGFSTIPAADGTKKFSPKTKSDMFQSKCKTVGDAVA